MMTEEKVLLNATLCYLVTKGYVLLGFKTKKIGANRWNGYGGGIEEGETLREAAARELFEESQVRVNPKDLKKIAIADFHNTNSDEITFSCRVHVYMARKWDGEPQPSEEMADPTWFSLDRLPLDKMMPADKEWVRMALEGKNLLVEAHLGPFQKELLGPVKIREVDEFPEEE